MKIGGYWGEELAILWLFLHKNGQNEYLCLIDIYIGGMLKKRANRFGLPLHSVFSCFLKFVIYLFNFDKHIFK